MWNQMTFLFDCTYIAVYILSEFIMLWLCCTLEDSSEWMCNVTKLNNSTI